MKQLAEEIPTVALINAREYNDKHPKERNIEGIVKVDLLPIHIDAFTTVHPDRHGRLFCSLPSQYYFVSRTEITTLLNAHQPFAYLPLRRLIAQRYWENHDAGGSIEERTALCPDGVPLRSMRFYSSDDYRLF